MDAFVHFWDQLTGGEKIALLGVVIVWVVYRADRRSQRNGLMKGVASEMSLHKRWVGDPYPPAKKPTFDPTHMPFKLGTVAIDDAIVRGPSLFLNGDLSSSLVIYRQVIGHYNQLVDQLMEFQSTPELWVPGPQKQALTDHVLELIEAIHIVGIGDLANMKAAHAGYKVAGDELGREQRTKILPIIWVAIGLNLFFLKRWCEWL